MRNVILGLAAVTMTVPVLSAPAMAREHSRYDRYYDNQGYYNGPTWRGRDGYFAGETLRIATDHLNLDTFVFTRTPYDPQAPVPGGVDERGWR